MLALTIYLLLRSVKLSNSFSFNVIPRCKPLTQLRSTAENECSLFDTDGKLLDQCLRQQGYDENTSEHMMVTRVFKANLESLRHYFPSSDTANHRMEFQRPQPPPLHGRNSTAQDPSTPCDRSETWDNPTSSDAMDADRHNEGKDASHTLRMNYNELLSDDDIILVDTVRSPYMQSISRAFIRAGPRAKLHFYPSKVNAAIVTCGGLCPGLNNVIRELTHALYYLYGVNQVWGVRGGYHGFHNLPDFQPILLTEEMVEDVHHEGGTILRSSRGGFDVDKIVEFLLAKNIQQLYVIGGDGTHRGAYKIHQECLKRKLNIAIAGIPKTIDNDVDCIDRSFGFLTAVEAAQASIRTAKTEAMCTMPNGVTVVKLMGRSAGFLAAFSALGSGDVDCLLIPEIPIVLDGPNGILPFIRKRTKEQKYAVIVVVEGAGEELLGQSEEVDSGGNRKLPPIGEYIKQRISEHFASFGEECTIRYIDPSYTVRSVPANACDSLYCTHLAQCAVHGAMAGYTGFSTGLVNNQMAYIPIPQLASSSPRSMDPSGANWEKIIAMTGQPNHAPAKPLRRQGTILNDGILVMPEHPIP